MFANIMKSVGSSSVDSPPGVVSIPKKKAKASLNKEGDEAADTPKSSASVLEGNKRVVDAWEMVKPLRFDPSKKSSVSVQLTAEEAARRNTAAQSAALLERQLQREKEEVAVAQAKEDAIAAEGAKKVDNFANLDSLKNIFYQEVCGIPLSLSIFIPLPAPPSLSLFFSLFFSHFEFLSLLTD
jgi:hypothetical protein